MLLAKISLASRTASRSQGNQSRSLLICGVSVLASAL